MATLTTLQSVLKEFYAKAIAERLNQEVLMLQLFERAKLDWSGKRVIIPVHTARNPGVDFKAEGAALPTAGSQTYNELHVTAKFLYGRFSLTGPAISSAKGAYSFGNYVDLELRRLTQDVRKKANESMFSGGTIPCYMQQDGPAIPPTAAVFALGGQTIQIQGNAQWVEDLRVAAGGQVDCDFVRTDTNDTIAFGGGGSAAITAVDVAANTATMTMAGATLNLQRSVTGLAGDSPYAIRVLAGSPARAIVDEQFTGINMNLSSALHFGVSRTTGNVTALRCTSVKTQNTNAVAFASYNQADGGASPLTLQRWQAVIDDVHSKSGKQVNQLMTNPVHRSTYTQLLTGGNTNLFVDTDRDAKGDGGFSSLSFNGIPIKTSVDCGKHIIYMLTTKTWKLAELEKPGFADLDGNILSRSVNLDAYEGYYRMYMDLYCEQPNANGALVGFATVALS